MLPRKRVAPPARHSPAFSCVSNPFTTTGKPNSLAADSRSLKLRSRRPPPREDFITQNLILRSMNTNAECPIPEKVEADSEIAFQAPEHGRMILSPFIARAEDKNLGLDEEFPRNIHIRRRMIAADSLNGADFQR